MPQWVLHAPGWVAHSALVVLVMLELMLWAGRLHLCGVHGLWQALAEPGSTVCDATSSGLAALQDLRPHLLWGFCGCITLYVLVDFRNLFMADNPLDLDGLAPGIPSGLGLPSEHAMEADPTIWAAPRAQGYGCVDKQDGVVHGTYALVETPPNEVKSPEEAVFVADRQHCSTSESTTPELQVSESDHICTSPAAAVASVQDSGPSVDSGLWASNDCNTFMRERKRTDRHAFIDALLREIELQGRLTDRQQLALRKIVRWRHGRTEFLHGLKRSGLPNRICPPPLLCALARALVIVLEGCHRVLDYELACCLKDQALEITGLTDGREFRACPLWIDVDFWEQCFVLDQDSTSPTRVTPTGEGSSSADKLARQIRCFRRTLSQMLCLGVERFVCEQYLDQLTTRLRVSRGQMTVFRALVVQARPTVVEMVLPRSWLGHFGFSCRWEPELAQPVVQLHRWTPGGAALRGVRDGSLVEAIDGQSTTGSTSDQVEELLSAAPNECRFRFAM